VGRAGQSFRLFLGVLDKPSSFSAVPRVQQVPGGGQVLEVVRQNSKGVAGEKTA